jgi:hypothetical protein
MLNLVLGGLLMASPQTLPSGAAAGRDFRRVFHVAGVPGVKRDQRLDVSVATDDLIFERAGTSFHVPYARMKQVLLLDATRNYEKTTAAFAAATAAFGIPVGSLLILKKHKVDTVVVDYENERRGRMGLVIQVEQGKGQEMGEMLRKHGVSVLDPPAGNPRNTNTKVQGSER